MKHAVYTGTRNIYGDMETAAKSLIANSDVGKVWLLTEGGFDRWLPDMCEVMDVSGQTFFPKDGPNAETRFTYMALMRAALHREFPELGTVLSLDCDTVAVGDCSGAWDIDLEGCYFAAVQERWPSQRPGLQYCNVGVSLLNLEKLRDGKGDEIVSLINSHAYAWPEQDAMNYLCQGRIAEMPPEYNRCPWTVGAIAPDRIIHFAAESSWPSTELCEKKLFEQMYREMTWGEAMERHAKWAR